MEVPFDGALTKKEFAVTYRLARSAGPQSVPWLAPWTYAYAIGAFFAMVGVVAFSISPDHNGASLIFVVFGLVCVVIGVRMLPGQLWRSHPALRVRQTGKVSDTGIEYTNGEASALVKWDAFIGYAEHEGVIGLLGQKNQITSFPKTFFRDETDWSGFRELVDRHLIMLYSVETPPIRPHP